MTHPQLDSDALAIVRLNAWKKAAAYNWIVESQTCAEPVIVHVEFRDDDPSFGRMMLFPGFAAYRDYALLRNSPDAGLAISPLDILHWELAGKSDGSAELQSFSPGYAPHPVVADEERALLAPIVRECRGVMMRIEEDSELPARFAGENALFARREGLDGKWRDAPYPGPKELPLLREERIVLNRSECDAAGRLPFIPDEAWEVDFLCVPVCRTDEPRARLMYLLAGVDARTGERKVWDRMSVSPTAENGLQELWESLAGRLLKAMLKAGRIPGAVNVRSARMARFLRPLGLQIPFRLVQHGKLPALTAALDRAAKDRTL